MTDPITIVVDGRCIPQGSKRIGRNSGTGRPVLIDDNPKLRQWRHEVTVEAQRQYEGAPLVGAVTVDATFRLERPKSAPKDREYPTVKPDVDKLLRAILDSLTGVVFVDDAQVVGEVARKLYAERLAPGCTIVVKPVE